MKTAVFEYLKAPVLAAAASGAERLVAYQALQDVAKALGLRDEVKLLRKLVRAMRKSEALQADFLEALKPKAPKRPRNRDGQNGDGHNPEGTK